VVALFGGRKEEISPDGKETGVFDYNAELW